MHAGKPAQLGIYVTERGSPVTELWPFLDAPGYLWVIGQDGQDFAFVTGAAEGRSMSSGSGTAIAAPTLMPGLQAAVSSRTAQPVATLVPVQQTALVSVVQTPGAVVPSTAHGPLITYTHTFPKTGLYKIWSEMQYRGQPILVDWVVNIEP